MFKKIIKILCNMIILRKRLFPDFKGFQHLNEICDKKKSGFIVFHILYVTLFNIISKSSFVNNKSLGMAQKALFG